jgi:hypothetical protein
MIARLLDGPLEGQTYDVPDPPPAELEIPSTTDGTGAAAGRGFVRLLYRLTDEGSDDSPSYRHSGF